MSSPRKRWWGYVRSVLYAYPGLKPENETEQREKTAVEAALEDLNRSPEGAETRRLVNAVFFTRQYTLTGAAMREHMSYRTARRRQNAFIRLVGEYMDLR